MAERKNWLRKRIEWLENNRFSGSVLLLAFCLGTIGGIASFVRESANVCRWAFRESDEIRLQVEVQNARTNSVEIDPICRLELTERRKRGSTTYTSEFGERLSPVGSFSGTNEYFLEPGALRNYRIRLRSNQVIRDMMERGTTSIMIVVASDAGDVGGEIDCQKNALQKDKIRIRFD